MVALSPSELYAVPDRWAPETPVLLVDGAWVQHQELQEEPLPSGRQELPQRPVWCLVRAVLPLELTGTISSKQELCQ